jgi:ferredoxin-NADP reductase
MLQPWQTGKVIRIEDETPTTKRFWIEVPGMTSFDFKPGQFVTLDLPVHEKPNKRWRSYSIASWPDGSNIFELVIVYLEGGAGTGYLFREINVGSELTLRGPQGVFVLPDPIESDLFFICTGTGIAPFRSMIHHIHNHNIPHRDIYLIFGCRKFPDSLYGAEMRMMEEKLPDFFYIPTFSRELASNANHLVRLGYVHHVYEEICRKKIEERNEAKAKFFLCGWRNMIDEAKQRIQQLGYEKKAIHQELYG